MTTINVLRMDAPLVRARWLVGGMLGLALGYFFWYTPYAALTKALSSGLLPGVDKQVGGLVLLPTAALGTLVGAAGFLAASGWWRYLGHGRASVFPGRTMIIAGFFMSLVIATTTLNYTFAGVSILFMLLMMRSGVLILSPIVDTARRRRVRVYSWVALGLSLLAVTAALSDVSRYELTLGAVISLALYFAGYIGRFQIMSKVAKTGDERIDRGYLAREMMTAAVWQVVLCAVVALVGLGSVGPAMREGFSSFLLTPAALPAFAIGLLYSALYVYGTLIYLDPREYTWCVPANRCASLVSGLVASFGLTWLTGIPAPGSGQLMATAFIGLAIIALSYPALRALAFGPRAIPAGPILLFVCDGNTSRSAMAETLARAEIAAADSRSPWQIVSAGLSAKQGHPMTPEAVAALRRQGIRPRRHRSRELTPELIARARVVYCMSGPQCESVRALASGHEEKVVRLDPRRDVANPAGQSSTVYDTCADQIRTQVRLRLAEIMTPVHSVSTAGA